MSSWYKVTVPYDDTLPNSKGKHLQDEFGALFIASAAPKTVALFGDRSDDFKQYFYYFSPAAARMAAVLINKYGGTTCSAPSAERLVLLVGHAGLPQDLLKDLENS